MKRRIAFAFWLPAPNRACKSPTPQQVSDCRDAKWQSRGRPLSSHPGKRPAAWEAQEMMPDLLVALAAEAM